MEKSKVMVVDDQPALCKEVVSFLKDSHDVLAFKNGKEALAYLEKNKIDLILMDYYMPEQTGFEVLLSIRQNQALKSIPVIFLTSEINERMKHELTHRGASDYLMKPIDSTKLRNCVSKYLA